MDMNELISPRVIKQEEEDLPGAMDNTTISTSIIKMELEWDNLANQYCTGDTEIIEWDKPEFILIVRPEEKMIAETDGCVLDISDKICTTAKDGDLNPLIKSETIGIKANAEAAFVECEIKIEEIDLKAEDSELNEIRTPSGLLNQEKNEDYKKFQCHVCNFQTNWKESLKGHLLRHKDPKEDELLRCDRCDFKTVRRQSLKIHSFRHKNPEEADFLTCDKCDYRTYQKFNFNRHLILHQNPEEVYLFRCDKCDFKTIHELSLKVHFRRHGNPDDVSLFKCEICDYQTPYKSDLKRHNLRHKNPEEVELFKCDKCCFKTMHKRSFSRHLLRHPKREIV